MRVRWKHTALRHNTSEGSNTLDLLQNSNNLNAFLLTFSVSIHVDKDMYAISMNPVGSLAITRDLGQVNEVLGLTGNLLTETRAIIRAQRVAEDLENKEQLFLRCISYERSSI